MQIDGYVLYEPVAFSKHGPVWRALDQQGNERAVQVLGRPSDETWQENTERLLTVKSEHLVAVRQIENLDAGRMAVISDLATGQNLELLSLGQRLETAQLNMVALCVARALVALHERCLCHGDISAANIMVLETGQIQVLDYLNLPGEAGTPPFSAPERPQGATPAADMYAWAALLHHLGLRDTFLDQCLNIDPALRPQAAQAVALFSDRPTEVIPLLDQATLGGAKLRAAGKDTKTIYAQRGRAKNRPALRRERKHGPQEESTGNAHSGPRRRQKQNRQRPGSKGHAGRWRALASAVVLCAAASALTYWGPTWWDGAHHWWTPTASAQQSNQKTDEANTKKDSTATASTAKDGTATGAKLAVTAPQPSAGVTGWERRAGQSPEANSVGPAPDPLEEAKNLHLGGNDEGQEFINQWLALRDRALREQNQQLLAALSVPGSAVAQSDASLLASLRGAGVKVEGLQTGAQDVQVTSVAGGQARIGLTLNQQAYTQIDRSGQARQIEQLAPQRVEFIFKSKPWRLAAVVPVSR